MRVGPVSLHGCTPSVCQECFCHVSNSGFAVLVSVVVGVVAGSVEGSAPVAKVVGGLTVTPG